MSFSDKKLEIAILGLVVVMLGGLGYVFKTPIQKALPQDFSFEMPRPKAFFAALFDLGGREVERTYTNPFEKAKTADKKPAPINPKGIPAPAVVAQVKKAPVKKADEKKSPKLEVTVVQEAKKPGLGEDGMGRGETAQQTPPEAAKADVAADNTIADENKMGADQWRALLRAQPTKENVQKLAQAYANKEIDDAGFYAIVADLLRSNQAETQSLGVYALTFSYSARSFAVATQYYDQLTPEAQTQAHTYLVSYATSGRHAILMGALESGHAATVEVAAQVVLEGYQKAQQGTGLSTAPPRESRGDNLTTGSVAGYSKFVPIFQRLAQSQDPAIAQLASTALSQIRVSVAAL